MEPIKATDIQKLEVGVQAMVLNYDVPAYEDPSKVLFVRPCIREICNSMIDHRKKSMAGKAAICGQPGIGKSYAMFYLAYKFLEEDGVDAIVLENSESRLFYFFIGAEFDRAQLSNDIRDSGKEGVIRRS